MNIQSGSITRKILDSNNVTHYHCNVVTKTRGVMLNVWAIECGYELSLHDLLNNGKSFNSSFNEYLKKHNLKILQEL